MKIKCSFCNGKCIKNGFQSNGNQRYKCCVCQKRQQSEYGYNAYKSNINQNIILFTKEGLGIRSIARILKISTTTLLKRIVSIARSISKPIISKGKTYEVDELCTYIRHKKNYIWLVYALEKNSRTVVSFNLGKRTNKTLNRVLDTLKLSEAKKIFTDRLKNYRYLIDEKLHSVKRFGTNHIERKNLTLRTHLKRLNRRTICFSKSIVVFAAVLKIYFWV
ncbi:IS1 family transposase [Flavobacterium tructae]|uniref:Transposase n=1 Tax=Flavobacterium tructae TaxID=1114873 RepID=A0A1S1J3A6_9FLAO|nr:IS1 family transposase [Flavobacterium tructae]OHT43949.1 transposase [Flavobacterium tructae]OXB21536.1 transposase [Flavobacterium tructae]